MKNQLNLMKRAEVERDPVNRIETEARCFPFDVLRSDWITGINGWFTDSRNESTAGFRFSVMRQSTTSGGPYRPKPQVV
jgi:hypothetical protein